MIDDVRRLLAAAVADGVVPGAAVLLGKAGTRAVATAGVPKLSSPHSVSEDTVYDLASLTKALVTSVLAMQAVESGRLRLDDSVDQFVPDFVGAAKDDVRVRHLLSHSSGLPAHRPLHAGVSVDRASIVSRAAAEPLVTPPGQASVYSDLGFIVLGDVLERRCGGRLDALCATQIQGRASLSAGQVFQFAPLDPRWVVAATEDCPVRGRVIEAEVHDLNAWAMAGVAGHAGLFGNLHGVAAVVESLLGGRLVDPEVVRLFWTSAGVPGSTWRLGWDGPSAHRSLAGDTISRAAVGHLAFTGCSIWIEPARETFVLMLSNRVHPVVQADPRFSELRRAVNDAALA